MSSGKTACGSIGRIIVATIDPGNDLLLSLQDICTRENISNGVIISCVGSLKRTNIRNLARFPESFSPTDADRIWKSLDNPSEIVGLSGNISSNNGEPKIHAHIVVSTVKEGRVEVLGGHLVEGNTTFVKVEVVLAEFHGISMRRKISVERNIEELHPMSIA